MSAHPEEKSLRYAVTLRSAVAMEKLPYAGPYTSKAPDGSEVYFSSCGFAKITYEIAPLFGTWDAYEGKRTRRETYLFFMGEFCDSYPALFEEENRGRHLIAYDEREGKKYLSHAAEIFADDDDHLYVADPEFLQWTGLGKLARPISHGPTDQGCYTPPPGESLDRGGRVLVGEQLCFETGVYLTDIEGLSGPRTARPRHAG